MKLKYFMKILHSLLIYLFTSFTFAQSSIEIGKLYNIKSKFLNENREIMVSLPESYNNSNFALASYPVVYVLDGESHFQFINAVTERFSGNNYPTLPELIIVGIKSTDRYRDFTSTTQSDQLSSGKSENFTNFLQKEVIPFISKNYRTTDYKILIGHSLSGLYALDQSIKRPNQFDAYIAHDPSIWWDNLKFLKDIDTTTNVLKTNRVFISQVDAKNGTGRLQTHYNGIQSVRNKWETNSKKGPIFKYIQYEGEDHGTVPFKANLDAIRWVFDGFQIEIRELANNKNLLENSFENFSKSRNKIFVPSENYLSKVVAYLKRVNATESLHEVLKYYEKIYPSSKQLKKYKSEL